MEELMKAGKIRAIGVSNFMPHHLDALLSTADVVPAVNQIEFHPGCKQPECVDYCRAHGILVEAGSPLGCGRVLGNEILGRVAARHHCSPAQLWPQMQSTSLRYCRCQSFQPSPSRTKSAAK